MGKINWFKQDGNGAIGGRWTAPECRKRGEKNKDEGAYMLQAIDIHDII
jgi:hypothetical protein